MHEYCGLALFDVTVDYRFAGQNRQCYANASL
jgi:hypothetical protein